MSTTDDLIPPTLTGDEFVATKFYDPMLTCSFLSPPDVGSFRRGSDWFKLLRLGTQTWPKLAAEFVSSLHLFNVDDTWLDTFSIEFRLLGVRYALPMSELKEIYSVHRAESRTEYLEFDVNAFWHRIAVGPDYNLNMATASHIRNPTIRYIHYVIANTIFGRRRGVQRVIPQDLFAIWCLTVGNQANMVFFMLKYIDEVARFGNIIVIGGMLTPIFEYLGVNLDLQHPHPGKNLLDFDELVPLGMFSPRFEGGCYLHFADRPSMRLPNFEKIRLDYDSNWHMEEEV